MLRYLLTTLKPGMTTLWLAVAASSLSLVGSLSAQTEQAPQPFAPLAWTSPTLLTPETTPPGLDKPIVDPQVKQASGCCALPPLRDTGVYGCSNGHCSGRPPCGGNDAHNPISRIFLGCLEEICCPDPCYEPQWIAAANAAFFQDSPRPVTQTRIHWDLARNYRFPDTAEFFLGQVGVKGLKNPLPSANYSDLYIYQEIAAKGGGASAFVEMSYRSLDPLNNPGAGGLGDMNVGVKTVLLDRELLLVTMQFKTCIPSGNFFAGLGTGHVALEPSLMAALKITHSTYLQAQVAEWIPLGGGPGFAGSVFHYHASLNQDICRHGNLFSILATMEVNGYSFRGAFTDFPSGDVVGMNGATYTNIGPGIRFMFCERADFGVAAAYGLGHGHGPVQLYRTEFRVRF